MTLPQRLDEAGYSSALFGKWHLGDRIENNPIHYGFDEFRGHTYGDSDYISHVDRHGDPDWWHNLEREEEEGYNTTLLTDHSVRFIEENTDSPFFLYLAHSAIHFPWMVPDDPPHRRVGTDYTDWHPDIDAAISKLGPHQNVGPVIRRMIEELDRSVGRLLDALESTGQERDTFVLFASDNGGYRHYAGLHAGDISSNGPFRGQKTDMYEGGHRVPAIIRWPGMIEPGSEIDETALTMDIFPTFLDMIDLEENTGNPALDGVSILPLLLEGKALPRRPLFWKMRERRAVRDGVWKLVQNGDGAPELYNLEEDIGETQDLAPQNPARVEKLVGQLEEWETEVGPR